MTLNRVLLSISVLLFSFFLMRCSADQPAPLPAEDSATVSGLITIDSPFSFEETGTRMRTTLEERDLQIPADLNHQKNAASVGMELLPTRIIIFGNPNLGTPLMQCTQSIAIDLPQKILIWENETGAVQVAYNEPNYLKKRHNVKGCDEAFENVANALHNLMEDALSE